MSVQKTELTYQNSVEVNYLVGRQLKEVIIAKIWNLLFAEVREELSVNRVFRKRFPRIFIAEKN